MSEVSKGGGDRKGEGKEEGDGEEENEGNLIHLMYTNMLFGSESAL